MLKIKDDVNLKELEKFGFYYQEYDETCDEDEVPYILKYYINNRGFSWINLDDRLINPENEGEWVDYDLIYDLIKADLVEKV